MLKRISKILGAIVFVCLIVIQFFQPKKNILEMTDDHIYKHVNMDSQVKTILDNACMDCHSNFTNYEWYHKTSPISWYVYDHIVEGKKVMNFSDWGRYTKLEKIGLLDEIREEVEEGEMPLKSYSRIHRNADLTEEEKKYLAAWAVELAEELLLEK